MSWTKEVFAHANKYETDYIEHCIQESINITIKKLLTCLYDEKTNPIQRVESVGNINKLYVKHDIFMEYDTVDTHLQIHEGETLYPVTDPLDLIDWLDYYCVDAFDYQKLKIEIENHLINQALSFIHCSTAPKSDHPLLHSEQYVITGHNIHPCAKTKLGLTFNEVMLYSPEYNQAFKLNWLLIKQGLLFNNLEDEEMQKIAKFSGYNGEIPTGYDLIPVHPYQFEHTIPQVYKEEIEQKSIIPLKHKGGLVKSTSSFRTVCPLDHVTPLLKLPVNSQMTSTIRSISNNSIINSKNIGQYFEYIYNNDERLKSISIPVLEFGGMTYLHDIEDKQRNLSFILRENNTKYITTNASFYTATCLFEHNEKNKKIYIDLIESASDIQSPIEWFEQYASILIETTLTLMTKYGIGLEAHLQNISYEFAAGVPLRLHLRDFGGLRIDASRTPEWLTLSQALTNATTEGMYEKVQNTLISNHLNTLITHFSEDFDYNTQTLWRKVSRIFNNIFGKLQEQHIPHAEDDLKAFYTETINEKALLTMRVSNNKDDIYIQRANPLLINDEIKI